MHYSNFKVIPLSRTRINDGKKETFISYRMIKGKIGTFLYYPRKVLWVLKTQDYGAGKSRH